MQTLDLRITEIENNGGDLQLVGSDLSVVYGIENMVYLALFGGNIEESTKPNFVTAQSFDFWGNNLFLKNNPGQQFNSETERTINSTPLTSNGRTIIERAIKTDLDFFKDIGAKVEVSVIIKNVDHLYVSIKITQDLGAEKIIIINFKKSLDGDFFIPDFDLNDFFI